MDTKEFKETVTIHGFNQKEGSALNGVFVAYCVEGKPRSSYGLWIDHPKLKAVMDLIGGKDRNLHYYTVFPDVSQEDFKELVDLDKLVEDTRELRKV